MNENYPSTEVLGLITRDTMFDPLLAADPTFSEQFNAFLDEYREQPQTPLYLALAALARHLIHDLEVGDTSRFDPIFDVVERWHVEGDGYVQEAASIGLLEDLQNTGLHRTTTPQAFLHWLRPVSRDWWDKVNAFWEEGTPIRAD